MRLNEDYFPKNQDFPHDLLQIAKSCEWLGYAWFGVILINKRLTKITKPLHELHTCR